MSYADDLRAVPHAYREALRLYVEEGVIPDDRLLVGVLAGRTARPHDFAAVGRIFTFLHRNVSPRAWGSTEAMARWEFMARSAVRYA